MRERERGMKEEKRRGRRNEEWREREKEEKNGRIMGSTGTKIKSKGYQSLW